MLKLATILDNPGEVPAETRYRDPEHLRRLGYNGIVLYETTALSGVDSPDSVGTGEMRNWVAQQFESVGHTIQRATQAGMETYIFYDVLSLSRETVNRQVGSFTCKNRPTTLCPASDAAIERSRQALESLLTQLPAVSGVVLRIGDNDAARLPYLIGNDIYSPHCPRCSQFGRADRIATILQQFHQLVVEKLGKRLIARAWNVRPNGIHDSIELCQRLQARLPGAETDDRFILSFKFTQTDFWRYQKWNPCSLVCGRRPIIYEFQCQREFEGKGGIPNWQAPMWQRGYPEMDTPTSAAGLQHVKNKINLSGVWAWVRGGGWGGPFIQNETWIDANVFALPQLADNPDLNCDELARRWIDMRLALRDEDAIHAVMEVLHQSHEIVRKSFYIEPFVKGRVDPWHPNADWIQDDLLDANAAWRIIQRLPEFQLDDVIREKQEAVDALGHCRALLQHATNERNRGTIDPLVNTLIYGESLLEALRDLLTGLVAYRRFQKAQDGVNAQLCRQRMLAAQSHWNHHTQRHGSLPGAATAFRESHLWELTQRMLSEVS